MTSKIDFVIPLGNGDPNTDAPCEGILINTCENIKKQTIPVNLTFAIDKSLKKKKLAIIEKYADDIKIFDTESSYFSRGGIWLKIYNCWEQSKCPYVCWSGYDDFSSIDRFEKQLIAIETNNGNSCFCNSYVSGDGKDGHLVTKSSDVDFRSSLGSHVSFMGAWLLKKDAIINSGIDKHKLLWAYGFEDLLNSYILKMGKICRSEGSFFYHDHRGTISNTGRELNPWVQEIRKITSYSLLETENDWKSINFKALNDEIRKTL
jgi:hypothetical protein